LAKAMELNSTKPQRKRLIFLGQRGRAARQRARSTAWFAFSVIS